MNKPTHNDGTPWGHVSLLYFCGFVAAAQVGKAIVSLPIIRVEIGLGIDSAGSILSVFATLGAACGIGGGALVSWFGARRALLCGMIGLAVGNCCAIVATDAAALMVARAMEGAGFFGVALATPSLLSRMTAAQDRDLVMGLWSAYMPIGIMAMLLLGPALPLIGWQNLWLANAVIAGLLCIVIGRGLPATNDDASGPRLPAKEIGTVLASPRCMLIAGAFFAYSFNYFSLAFVLPLLFTSVLGHSLANAALFGAAAMGVSALGHLASGPLLRAGLPIWTAIALTFAVYAGALVGMFSAGLATPQVAMLAALALGVGGLAPGAFYSAAPRVAPHPQALPTTIGLFQQASNLGQFAGPITVGAFAEHLGWQQIPLAAVPVALAGFGIAFAIRRYLRSEADRRRTGASFGLPGAKGGLRFDWAAASRDLKSWVKVRRLTAPPRQR
jgi:DHA1 family inner membrane transport protein